MESKTCYTFIMNAPNYERQFQTVLSRLSGNERLLLHCCCAPCSSACLERLKDHFKITALFYNPNIEDGEYQKRKAELIRFISATGYADFLDCDRDTEKFYAAANGLENAPEGGERCEKCFRLRLEKTARLADELGYDYFCTTLTLSPLKNAEALNKIGESVQKNARWLPSDFKKKDGYKRSLELSESYGLYRQNYCGCVYSRRGRE